MNLPTKFFCLKRNKENGQKKCGIMKTFHLRNSKADNAVNTHKYFR